MLLYLPVRLRPMPLQFWDLFNWPGPACESVPAKLGHMITLFMRDLDYEKKKGPSKALALLLEWTALFQGRMHNI